MWLLVHRFSNKATNAVLTDALHTNTGNAQIIQFNPKAGCLTSRSVMLTLAWLTLPLSWWFLSGCTGRGLDTRLGLLLTLLALTEFIWGVGNLEEMSKPSQQQRRRQAHYLMSFSSALHDLPSLAVAPERRSAVYCSRSPALVLRLAPFCCSRRSHNRQAQSVRQSHHMGGHLPSRRPLRPRRSFQQGFYLWSSRM